MRFILIVIFSSTIPTILVLYISYFIFHYPGSSTTVYGMSPLYMAFSVATKQLTSDTGIQIGSLLYIRSTNLSLISFLVLLVLSLFMGSPFTFIFGVCGFVSGWIYLRFFQRKTGGIVGDQSNVFAFHTLFPEIAQGPIKTVEGFFGKLKSFYLARRHSQGRNDNNTNDLEEQVTIRVDSAEAERRKKIALHVVNEKIYEDNN